MDWQLLRYPGTSGESRSAIVSAPVDIERQLPVILAPHPAGWTAEEDVRGGANGVTVIHQGWQGVAEKYGVVVVAPHSYGSATELTSLGYPPSLEDSVLALDYLENLGIEVNWSRVYACGLSMGGQESLLFLAKYPELFAAGVAFNPVVDLAACHDDFQESPYYDLLVGESPENGLDAVTRLETGGTPEEVPDVYAERSPITYAEELTARPLLLYWSHLDPIVPNQAHRQSKRLYDAIKAVDPYAPVAEFNHTYTHGYDRFGYDERVALHEYSDYDLATRWLLSHVKRTA